MKVQVLRKCPACGAGRYRTFDLAPNVSLRRCRACGLVFATEFADPDAVYSEGYLDGTDDTFGIDTSNPIFEAFILFIAGKRLDLLGRFAADAGSLLDVGCGSAETLSVAMKRGWEVTGTEPYPESAERARSRGVEVHQARLEEVDLPVASFDVVSAFHVLEHMEDGVDFIRSLSRFGRPGGLILLEVPNWNSLDRRRHGAEWDQLCPLEHLAHYTPSTLSATMRRAGLEVVFCKTVTYLWPALDIGQRYDSVIGTAWRRLEPQFRRFEQSDRRAGPPTSPRVLSILEKLNGRLGLGFASIAIGRVPNPK